MVFYAAAAFLASGLVASVSAGSVHHVHGILHKRGGWEYGSPSGPPAPSYPSSSSPAESCGYATTYTTTWYGPPGLVPGPSTYSSSTSTSSSTWVAPTSYATPTTTSEAPPPPSYTSTSTSTSTTPPPPPPTTSSSTPAYTPPVVPSKPVSQWSPPKSPSIPFGGSGGFGSITPNGDKWAMTYTPYTTTGECKSASDVMNDIGSIKSKGFSTVRLYATDCSGVENVGSACNAHGMKMIMGIYIDASGLSNAYSQLGELTSWGKSNGWDKVEMVVAGNEAVFNGYCTASDLAGFISDVKSKFKTAGYTGPVTTTEPMNIIQENAETFCGAVDVIAANIHPFFNGGVTAAGAGAFVASQMALLSQACNGEKDAYNLETGWPSKGDANGAAIPGSAEQRAAINSIVASSGSKSAIFSFEDDEWKAPGDLGVEQWWGCASVFSQS